MTARTKAHDDEITAATVGVLAEELAPLAKKAVEAARDFAMARDVVIEGGALARSLAQRLAGGPGSISAELMAAQKALDKAIANPTADSHRSPLKAAWAKFADGLAAGDDGLYFGVKSSRESRRLHRRREAQNRHGSERRNQGPASASFGPRCN